MPSNHLILWHPLLLLPSIFPSIRVFSNELILWLRWPKYWSFSFSISPSNEHSGPISFSIDWFDIPAIQGTPKSLFFTLGHWVPFFGGIQHSPVNDCSAVSCNFRVPAEEDGKDNKMGSEKSSSQWQGLGRVAVCNERKGTFYGKDLKCESWLL